MQQWLQARVFSKVHTAGWNIQYVILGFLVQLESYLRVSSTSSCQLMFTSHHSQRMTATHSRLHLDGKIINLDTEQIYCMHVDNTIGYSKEALHGDERIWKFYRRKSSKSREPSAVRLDWLPRYSSLKLFTKFRLYSAKPSHIAHSLRTSAFFLTLVVKQMLQSRCQVATRQIVSGVMRDCMWTKVMTTLQCIKSHDLAIWCSSTIQVQLLLSIGYEIKAWNIW